jgi:hypothetical protein
MAQKTKTNNTNTQRTMCWTPLCATNTYNVNKTWPLLQKTLEVKRIEHSFYAEIVGNITTRNSERKDTRRQNNPIVLAGHICVQDIELKVMVGQPDLFVCLCFYLLLFFLLLCICFILICFCLFTSCQL